MKIVKKHKMIALVIVILICLLYLKGNSTYTSYESEVTGNVESDIADWKIKVNDTMITTENEQVINIDSISWETNHTRDGKASPGASGTIEITIDPTSTGVAFNYELTVIDQTVDPTKILVVNEIDTDVGKLEKIDNTYYGSMSLADIKAGKKVKLTIHVKWEDHGEDTVVIPGEEPTTSDFIEMSFKVAQKK